MVEEGLHIIVALRQMAACKVDFADAYLAERARLAGAPVASFDRDFDWLAVERWPLAPDR